jgi:AcrR family transcriptional regulator
MARSAEVTKSRIFSAAYQLLYREGFSRTSMDAIANAAGLTKKTLYSHYDSKDALVAAILEHQQAESLALFQRWADLSAKDAATFVGTLFAKLHHWASSTPWYGSGFTRLTMELADLPGHPARMAAHRHKAAVEDWLSGELKRLNQSRPKVIASQLMVLIEGCMSLALIHQDATYILTAAKAANRLLKDASR